MRVLQNLASASGLRSPARASRMRIPSPRQSDMLEHDKALKRVITAMFKDDAQLFKQFQAHYNDSFRRWLTDTIFGMTYERVAAGETGAHPSLEFQDRRQFSKR